MYLGLDARLRAAASVLQLLKFTSSSLTPGLEVPDASDSFDDADDDDVSTSIWSCWARVGSEASKSRLNISVISATG